MDSFQPSRASLRIAAVGLALITLAAIPAAAGAATKRVAKEREIGALGRTVLTNNAGRTLYTLSAERNGRFICASRACLALWRPLLIAARTRPTGPVALGTVRRPDKRLQVTYKGRPLYTFAQDRKAGEANGDGVRDVGTWRAATIPARAANPAPPAQDPAPPGPPSPPGPYPYPSPY